MRNSTPRQKKIRVALVGVAALAMAGVGISPSMSAPPKVPPAKADPASQRQTSLAEAMRTPVKITQSGEVAIGAAKARPPKSKEKRARKEATNRLARSGKAKSEDVFNGDSAKAGGCLMEYGEPGQCLPPKPPRVPGKHGGHGQAKKTAWTCSLVQERFAQGLKVRTPGRDPLRLDTNKDGIACGKGDR